MSTRPTDAARPTPPDRIGCDGAITPEVLRRVNWTMVSAMPWCWALWNKVRHHSVGIYDVDLTTVRLVTIAASAVPQSFKCYSVPPATIAQHFKS